MVFVYQTKSIHYLSYFSHINAPWIVFLHDSFGCTKAWKNFPSLINQNNQFNTLIYDRLGYGQSDPIEGERNQNYLHQEVDPLFKLLSHLNIKKPILLGHSDGGTIALLYASQFAEQIDRIICIGAHVMVEDITINGIIKTKPIYEDKLKPKLFHYHQSKADWVYYSWFNTWTSSSFRDWSIVSELIKIKRPQLILQGENDEFGSLEQVKLIKKHTTGSTTVSIIPHAHHSPHKENPTEVVKAIHAFLQ